jgi:hypothetical protein
VTFYERQLKLNYTKNILLNESIFNHIDKLLEEIDLHRRSALLGALGLVAGTPQGRSQIIKGASAPLKGYVDTVSRLNTGLDQATVEKYSPMGAIEQAGESTWKAIMAAPLWRQYRTSRVQNKEEAPAAAAKAYATWKANPFRKGISTYHLLNNALDTKESIKKVAPVDTIKQTVSEKSISPIKSKREDLINATKKIANLIRNPTG